MCGTTLLCFSLGTMEGVKYSICFLVLALAQGTLLVFTEEIIFILCSREGFEIRHSCTALRALCYPFKSINNHCGSVTRIHAIKWIGNVACLTNFWNLEYQHR